MTVQLSTLAIRPDLDASSFSAGARYPALVITERR